jgi:hypothetical protein
LLQHLTVYRSAEVDGLAAGTQLGRALDDGDLEATACECAGESGAGNAGT